MKEIEWSDITSEEWRVYEFPCGYKVRIEKPTNLNVSESGGHRIVDDNGISHYIPKGWVHIYWKADPPFVL